jgi:hypothetical protein
MHASNGETVVLESKCGGFRGVPFLSELQLHILAPTRAAAHRTARLIVRERRLFHLYTIICIVLSSR